MRVIAGSAKGHRLKCPKGRIVRPTADRMREAIFSMVSRRIDGARVLDLYAGAGTLGIEALSRGAREAVFVERSGRVATSLAENLEKCRLQERATIVVSRVEDYVAVDPEKGDSFDLIFLDPPYRIANTEVSRVIKHLVERLFLAKGGLLVLERSSSVGATTAGRLVLRDTKTYGDTRITIFEERVAGEG